MSDVEEFPNDEDSDISPNRHIQPKNISLNNDVEKLNANRRHSISFEKSSNSSNISLLSTKEHQTSA